MSRRSTCVWRGVFRLCWQAAQERAARGVRFEGNEAHSTRNREGERGRLFAGDRFSEEEPRSRKKWSLPWFAALRAFSPVPPWPASPRLLELQRSQVPAKSMFCAGKKVSNSRYVLSQSNTDVACWKSAGTRTKAWRGSTPHPFSLGVVRIATQPIQQECRERGEETDFACIRNVLASHRLVCAVRRAVL